MKKIVLGVAMLTTFFAACNGASSSTSEAKTSADSSTTKTSMAPAATEVTKSTVSIKGILDTYLKMKNAFAHDKDKDAANAGKDLIIELDKIDKASLGAEQAKTYSDIKDDAKEHADHIATNAGNIKHQREHFDMLSKDIYQLVKTFGAGQNLYYDHCPMYNNNKGADWISETKEINNPYLGKAMPTCGSMKEELK